MDTKTLTLIRQRTLKNDKSEIVHQNTVKRRVDEWMSENFLEEQQCTDGLSFHDLCIYLFMIQMSRGYEDERLILQIFLMFVNRTDIYGRFGTMTSSDPDFEHTRMSLADLRVLLMSI